MKFNEIIPNGSNYNFLNKKYFALVISALFIVASISIWFSKGDHKFGVDFRGGTEIVIKFAEAVSAQQVRKTIEQTGLDSFSVQSFDNAGSEYSIKLGIAQEGSSGSDKIMSAVRDKFGKDKVELVKTDVVGPTIGKELRKKAMIAIALSVLGILIYISVRFEFAFALGAVVALCHDVIICIGCYLFFGREFSMHTLAAGLTIIGYSVNDTIIIFDRIREEILKQKNSKYDLEGLVNSCINATLSRTILTSLLTFFSTLMLLTLGGGEIKDLSLFLCVGIVAGTFSTIYIASPVVLAWDRFSRSREKSTAVTQ